MDLWYVLIVVVVTVVGVVRWVYAFDSMDVFKFVKLYTHTNIQSILLSINWKNKVKTNGTPSWINCVPRCGHIIKGGDILSVVINGPVTKSPDLFCVP